MKFPLSLSFDDVLLVPQRSSLNSRSEVNLQTNISPKLLLDIPIIAINMDTVTGVEMAKVISQKGGIAFMPRFDQIQEQAKKIEAVKLKKQKVIAALGLRDDAIIRAEMCVKAGADGLTVDVAHGHMEKCLKIVKELKRRFPRLPLSAGVVATYEGAYDLFWAGADAVRVGVGAGTICLTRVTTGCGVPQITAILEAVKAQKKFKNKYVIADGGIKNSGDIVKALAAGASAVTLGSLLAGTDEAPGKIIRRHGLLYKEYNASTSFTEKEKQKKNGHNHTPHFILHIEGIEALVPYRGQVSGVLDKLCAGMCSGFSYCGAKNILELWKKARFIQVTPAGYREGGVHDILLPENFSR